MNSYFPYRWTLASLIFRVNFISHFIVILDALLDRKNESVEYCGTLIFSGYLNMAILAVEEKSTEICVR